MVVVVVVVIAVVVVAVVVVVVCRVFTSIYLKQTVFLGCIVLQLFYSNVMQHVKLLPIFNILYVYVSTF